MTPQNNHFEFADNNELINIASPTSSKNDFDFYKGSWKIRNKKLKTRLNNCQDWIEFDATQDCRIILNGLGNIDHFYASFDGEPFEGMSFRYFDQETKLWSIYWHDVTRSGKMDPPVFGSFYGDIGYFYTKDTFEDKDILVKFEWDRSDINNPIWRQAFSEDNGATWEWNWYMYISKVL